MKTLFIGGIKSGKSHLAETYILASATRQPYYLATTEFIDEAMRERIQAHQQRRQDRFITLEEPLHLARIINNCTGPVLVECISMWLNNMLHHQYSEANILQELAEALSSSADLVFVQNEVGLGVIPDNALARLYVDLSGKVAQYLAAQCDAVYFCRAGLTMRMK